MLIFLLRCYMIICLPHSVKIKQYGCHQREECLRQIKRYGGHQRKECLRRSFYSAFRGPTCIFFSWKSIKMARFHERRHFLGGMRPLGEFKLLKTFISDTFQQLIGAVCVNVVGNLLIICFSIAQWQQILGHLSSLCLGWLGCCQNQ